MTYTLKIGLLVTLILHIDATATAQKSELHNDEGYRDTFEENLKVKTLPNGYIYTYFEFVINDADLSNHTRYFPRTLSDILIHHSVQELHYSLTQGYWRTESWGDPILSAPGGAQVIAWFTASGDKQASDNWKGLTSRLSGLTCASLNFLDDRNSINPNFGYRPIGVPSKFDTSNPLFVRVGSLPKENVCTENLTPWGKLLPCGVSRGLASLLRSKQVFNTHYHSAGISFLKTNSGVQLKLTMSLVFNGVKQGKYRASDNFVRRVFGPAATFPCHPSQTSSVQLWQNGTWEREMYESSVVNSWKISDLPLPDSSELNLIFTPVKYLGGYGQADGEIIVEMTNHLDVVLPVLYVEVLPWYIRPYLHTMKTQVSPVGRTMPEPGRLFHYTPGRDRQVLHKLEMDFHLSPKSTVRLSFVVEKRHLRWDEYPPDANHGFYLEASRFEVNYTNPEDLTSKTLHYYSRKLLVNLSTPDFSMPYNVICLTCTVVALAFGPLHNITTKSLKLTPKDDKTRLSSKLVAVLKRLWNKVRSKKEEAAEEPSESPQEEMEIDPPESTEEPMEIDPPEQSGSIDPPVQKKKKKGGSPRKQT